MRILHSSDWHLGKKLENFSRLPEQIEVLKEIHEIAEAQDVDLILIAGDLFDTYNPPAEAVDLFYKSLKKMSKNGKRPVIAISGNHDSPERIEAPDPLARECGIFFSGYPNSVIPKANLDSGFTITHSEEGFISCTLPNYDYPIRIIHTPYANELRLKAYTEGNEDELRDALQSKWTKLADEHCDEKGVNLLMTHLFVVPKGNSELEEPDDEKPILHVGGAQAIYTQNIPKQIQYTALGHIHRKIHFQKNASHVVYSGSPISYSFSEAEQDKYVAIVDLEPAKEAQVDFVKLHSGLPLVRRRFDNQEEALAWLGENPNCLVELTMISDGFLTAEQRKALNAAHDKIIAIIPEVINKELLQVKDAHQIDLSKNTEELFKEYFTARTGQEVNEDILALFKEINAN